MPKWWRSSKRGPETRKPLATSSPPPPAESAVQLPDPKEAQQALAHARESKRRTDDLGREVREMVAFLRAAREENNFAEGIVELIREGK